MAYQTGSASSPTDLLQKLVTWLTTLGWTTDMSQAEGTGWRAHMHKGSVYVGFRAAMNEQIGNMGYYSSGQGYCLGLNVGTGFNAGSSWKTQPGVPLRQGSAVGLPVCTYLKSIVPTYHFFSDALDNVVVVVESSPSIFGYLGWGPEITKAGVWTGGAYFFGSRSAYYWISPSALTDGYSTSSICPFSYGDGGGWPCAFVKVDIDTVMGLWLHPSFSTSGQGTPEITHPTKFLATDPTWTNSTPPDSIPGYGYEKQAYSFMMRQFTNFNSQVMMLPVHIYAPRDAGGYSLLGQAPNIYYCAATDHGIPAASTLLIGADTYRVFPNFAVKQV